jgi:hypothetical protein
MDSSGYIKLFRKFLEWEWYDDNNCKVVFLHLLLKSNYKQKRWRGKIIERGQLFTSIENLSNEMHLTTKQLRITLSKLENTGEITKQGTSEGTYITVCNYDSYQTNIITEQQADNERATSEQQANNKRTTTTNNNKKEKKEKNKKKEFVSPSLDEVKKYFVENGYYESAAIKAYNYYVAGNWVDSKGTPVTAWKQKMIGVWFKPENKMESVETMP